MGQIHTDGRNNSNWGQYMTGIIVFGALFRIAAAAGNGMFWFDEIITWEIAARPWHEMWKYLAVENHPPLHYALVHLWMQAFGQGEIAVKLSSVLAGSLGIWVTGVFGTRLFGARAGLWAAGITALSTYHIFFSAEARMYPWLYLFGTLSLWMWWEMMNGEKRIHRWIWFLSTTAALYTHLGGVFLLVVEGGWFAWTRWGGLQRMKREAHAKDNYFHDRVNNVPRGISLKQTAALMSGVLLAWLPWIVIFLKEKAQTFNRNAWYFWVELTEPLPIEATRKFFFFDGAMGFIDLFAWAFVIGALLLAFGMFMKQNDGRWRWQWDIAPPHGYCFAILFIPLMIGFLMHVSVIKIYTVASAGAWLLAGAGMAKIRVPRPIPPWLLPAAVAGLFFAHSAGVIVGVKPAWREVGQYLAAHAGEADAIVILSHAYQVALEHYYKGITPVLPFYPLPDDTGGDALLRAVRRNWYTILTDENIDQLSALVEGKQNIFLVVVGRFYKVERIGLEWFMERGWKLESVERWEDFMVNPEVYLFKRK